MKNHLSPIRNAGKLAALILLLSLGSSAGFSQNNTLSMAYFNLPATAPFGSSDTAKFWIKNLDNAVFSGQLTINYATDTSFTPHVLDSFTVTINSNDSIYLTSYVTFDTSNFFNPGSNIVVVWSSGNGKFAADSLADTITLIPAGIHEDNFNVSFSIFPSPAKDHITINMNRSAEGKGVLQRIKITDVFGRIIIAEPFSDKEEQKINVEDLSAGVYFLELLYADRNRAVQKFVKAD